MKSKGNPQSRVGRGRARDPSIDARVLETAARHLAAYGYEAMSVAAVAEEAGTTRQALYRRWARKPDLAAAAMAAYADHTTDTDTATADPFADLVAELTDFQRGVSRPGRLSLVGTMLQDSVEADVRARYQAQIIAPRRRRLRHILERAQRLDMIDTDADLDIAVTMCTGSWYARALAGSAPPRNWPQRTATLIWRAVGGTPPNLSRTKPRRPTR
jgi:AcrR family transcriptional regulator